MELSGEREKDGMLVAFVDGLKSDRPFVRSSCLKMNYSTAWKMIDKGI